MTIANTLAYYDTSTITAVKCSIIMSPGAYVIKLFSSVIYGFLYKAIVFVRLDGKSLQMTNTSLLRKSVIYSQKKFYNIGPRRHNNHNGNNTRYNDIKFYAAIIYDCS